MKKLLTVFLLFISQFIEAQINEKFQPISNKSDKEIFFGIFYFLKDTAKEVSSIYLNDFSLKYAESLKLGDQNQNNKLEAAEVLSLMKQRKTFA